MLLVGVTLLSGDELLDVPIYLYILLLIAISIGLAILFFKQWYFARRRIIKRTITARYEPPFGLNPLEFTVLYGSKITEQSFAGLLVHMSQRGIIHFRRHEGHKVIMPGPKYDGSLGDYEKAILDVLDKHKPLKAADLIANFRTIEFSESSPSDSLEKRVMHTMVHRHYLASGARGRYTFAILKEALLSSAVFIWLPLFLFFTYGMLIDGASDGALFMGILLTGFVGTAVIFIPMIFLVVLAEQWRVRIIGRKWKTSKKVRRIWPEVLGFREFVVLSELGKLHFQSDNLQKSCSVSTLPYAIAFGLVPNWKEIVS